MGQFLEILSSHNDLQNRFRHSEQFLGETRKTFSSDFESGKNVNVSVFAAGSLGRHETGRISDLDLFIIADEKQSRLQQYRLFADLINLNEQLKLPQFSGDGRYLKVHDLESLIEATGDPKDDSENQFTTRLLLLLESKPLSNETLYNKALQSVLENYFRDKYGKKNFQPLFLLNDILRYWRTICLNYERDRSNEKPWWKKNLNLKFSRKLTVFSTVLLILSKEITSAEDFAKFSKKVPLERLAIGLDKINDSSLLEDFEKSLINYESFLAAKSFKELEDKDEDLLTQLREKAEHFGSFIHQSLHSKNLDQELIRYLAV